MTMERGQSGFPWGRIALGTLAICLAVELTRAEKLEDPPGADGKPTIVSPTDQAVLMSGQIDVICTAGEDVCTIDGQPLQWEAYREPLRVTRIWLPPGIHELKVGDQRSLFSVALNEEEYDGPDDWTIHRYHEIDATGGRCADCHETSEEDGLTSVGELKSHLACLECHTPIEFEVNHSHILEPLEPCQMCHLMHGSSHESLLKAPMRQLCEECHDPDH